MSTVTVEDLIFDDTNEEKFWAHGIRPEQVRQLLDGEHVIKKNRTDRRATHLLVGRDRSGACIVAPIEATYERTIWRPITAWYCKRHEAAWLD